MGKTIVNMYECLMKQVSGYKQYDELSKKLKAEGKESAASLLASMASQSKGNIEALAKLIREWIKKDYGDTDGSRELLEELMEVMMSQW